MASIRNFAFKQAIRLTTYFWQYRNEDIPFIRRALDRFSHRLEMSEEVEVEPEEVRGLKAEWIVPYAAVEGKVFLYLHGGGYAFGSLQTHRALVAKIAISAGVSALLLDYRLAPEHPFPAAVEDAVSAYEWLLEEGYTPENIAIAGDSAGGGLTLAALLSIRDSGLPLPAAGVCLSPWTDLAMTGESIKRNAATDPILNEEQIRLVGGLYTGEHDPTHPLISPLYAKLEGLPPLLIQVSKAEMLLDDALRFAKRAEEAGVDVLLQQWPDVVHVWQFFWSYIPEAGKAIEMLGRYIKVRLRREITA
jgi:acetyl esterase/lipase